MAGESDLLDRVLDPLQAALSEDLARAVLELDFPPADHARCEALSLKAQQGTLSPDEEAELDRYIDVNDFLILLKAKASMALKRRNPAA
jgi:hypothetical protein